MLLRRVCLYASSTLFLFACGDAPAPSSEPRDEETGELPTGELTEVQEALPSQTQTLRVGVTFEARFDPNVGRLEFMNVQPYAEGLPQVQGDVVSVSQASYCAMPSPSDGVIGVNPPNTFEVYTEEGSTAQYEACFGGSYPRAEYSLFGVFCTDVTIRNFFDVRMDGVHAQIDEMVPSSGYRSWGAPPVGTGAVPTVGLSDAFGLWSYGDLTPADGAVGSGTDEETVTWLFENQGEAVYFQGRVVADVSEACGDDIDNDCDGLIDEECGEAGLGDDCNFDADCESGLCDELGMCDTPPPATDMGAPCRGPDDCMSGICWDLSLEDPFCFGEGCTIPCETSMDCFEEAGLAGAPFPGLAFCDFRDGTCNIRDTGLVAIACE